MSGWGITCDRSEDTIRAALWHGRELCDLYVDKISAPDVSGAIARGKVVRVLSGQKAGWLDVGLAERIYVENLGGLRAGQMATVRVVSTMKQGKAWLGEVTAIDDVEDRVGLLAPPPPPWERALEDLPSGETAELRFGAREDFEAFRKAGYQEQAEFCKESVHPELDEIIDALLVKRVPLPGGASLVIEPTEALIAIDVNAGEGGNPAAVNLLAVREAARQVRLRNLSGLIVIDCLKMKNRVDGAKVLNAFKRVAAQDPAELRAFGMTKLGLLEATRRRRGPSLADAMGE